MTASPTGSDWVGSSSLVTTMRWLVVQRGWHDVSVSVATVGSVVVITR